MIYFSRYIWHIDIYSIIYFFRFAIPTNQCSQMTFSKIRTNVVGKIRIDWKNSVLFFFNMGIKLKDFVSTIEIRHTFLNLTIPNYFISINHIFKCNSRDTLYSHCDIIRKLHWFNLYRIKNQNKIDDFEANKFDTWIDLPTRIWFWIDIFWCRRS